MFNGLVKLNFMEEIYEIEKNEGIDTTVVLQIKDYDCVGWYFDHYNQNKKIAFCKECGKIFKKKSNRQEYCSDKCSKEVNREKTKERMKMLRSENV